MMVDDLNIKVGSNNTTTLFAAHGSSNCFSWVSSNWQRIPYQLGYIAIGNKFRRCLPSHLLGGVENFDPQSSTLFASPTWLSFGKGKTIQLTGYRIKGNLKSLIDKR